MGCDDGYARYYDIKNGLVKLNNTLTCVGLEVGCEVGYYCCSINALLYEIYYLTLPTIDLVDVILENN